MSFLTFVLLVITSIALSLELPRALWPRPTMHALELAKPARRKKFPLAVGLGSLLLASLIIILNGGISGNGLIARLGFCAFFVGAASYFCLPLLYFIERGEDLADDDNGAMHAPDPVGTRLASGFAVGTTFLGAGLFLIWATGA